MPTTIEKFKEMRKHAGKNHDKILRAYYDEVNAHELGMPLPESYSGIPRASADKVESTKVEEIFDEKCEKP